MRIIDIFAVKRLWKALLISLHGFKEAFNSEIAFRQEVCLTIVLIPLAFCIPLRITHRILMIASVLLVLIVELLNSAIEALVDLASPERHFLAKRAKDFGSTAVFISLINVVLTWGLILINR